MTSGWRRYVRHEVIDGLYRGLPDPVKPAFKRVWHHTWSALARGYHASPFVTSPDDLHAAFVEDVFGGPAAYARYAEEFDHGPFSRILDDARERFQARTGRDGLAGIGLDRARDYYCVVRHLKPERVVETGVANGVSSLAILLAMDENGVGHLRAIDHPVRADEDLEAFREATFDGVGAPIIPSGASPGWIIPDELRHRWVLSIGKSQRALPQFLDRGYELDLFVFDAEHSHPCMMMEFEIALEWLRPGGMILADDIRWNDAFDVFCDVRDVDHGRLSRDVGYLRRPV